MRVKKMINRNSCPECNSNNLVNTTSNVVCGSCGLVLEKIIDTTGTPTYNTNEINTSRAGPALTNLKADYGLSTEIGTASSDAMGSKLSSAQRHRMRRLRWINSRSSKSEIRNLRTALRELKRLSAALGLNSETQSTASLYYRKALKAKLIRGRSINSMVAASVYLAARNHKFAIILKDLERHSNVEKKVIARCMRVLMTDLKIKPKLTGAMDHIPRLVSKLELTHETETQARRILDEARKNKLDVGKSPMSVAAAAIYLACLRTGERRTQQQVAEAAQTTPVTLRNRFRAISKNLTIDVEVRRGAAAVPVFFRPPVRLGRESMYDEF
ncbi:MAG: transcription initiation factor IIB [Candidatus Heimdallarchaeota archaeon]|nr:transcription initiation factor IIB [Candidatus Heimdallarchaeota archaeon]